jgi:hypothetical protein
MGIKISFPAMHARRWPESAAQIGETNAVWG